MDRTMIAPWKAEEKEQCEKLYKKLQGLALLYPMNDDMRKCLALDMFLKPNPNAFFQVMHYLFCLLDPAEFKRRFFWPITDKKSEANFRSCTVDYLKHLNEKHHLQWANIKSYLVVMPGGMKFINFMLEFVSFVVQELIKQREKSLGIDVNAPNLKGLTPQIMARQNAFMKQFASAYMEVMERNTNLLRERTQKIKQIFANIAAETGINEAQLMSDRFLDDFEASNRALCQEKITQPAARLATLEAPLYELKEKIEQFQTKQSENKHIQDKVDSAVRTMQKMFDSTDGSEAAENAACGGDKINALLKAFNNISENIAEQLDTNDHYNDSNEFVTTDLEALRAEIVQIENQVTNVQKDLNARAKEFSSNINSNNNSNALPLPSTPLRSHNPSAHLNPLLMKFVSTPPIKLELPGSSRSAHVRLPLQDDFNSKQFETFANSLLVPPPPPRSARKLKSQEQCADLSISMNRSKIIDPLQLLRTIHKQTTKVKSAPPPQNLSALGGKWKMLQASFDFDGNDTTTTTAAPPTSPKPSSASNYSPFTPLSSSERTRIERPPAAKDLADSSLVLAKKSAAVKKVIDASLNVQNLSTSPSGRLEPLVLGPLPEKEPQPLLLPNDKSLNDSLSQQVDKENVDVLNVAPNFALDFGEDDELQNISDGVLQDISI